MAVSELFYSGNKATDRTILRIGTEDKKLLQELFPESGVITSLSVYLFEQIVNQLKEKGIETYADRVASKFSLEDLKAEVKIKWTK